MTNPQKLLIAALVGVFAASSAQADLVISQYYEGTSNNKWIEVFNAGASSVDLGDYNVGVWSNANAEGYKTGAAPTVITSLPSFELASGGVFLLSHSSAALPAYATADFSNSTIVNFNGNDSFGIYASGAYSVSSLVDAIGFTNSGNEGQDKSFIRLSTDAGYSLASGSDVLDFGSVWQQVSLSDVANASSGTDAYLGTTTLAAIPEPTAALFGSLLAGALGLTVARRSDSRD